MEISINDKAYEAYKQKCRELGLAPTTLETLKRDGGVKPNFVDSKIKKEEKMEMEKETIFGKGGVKQCKKCLYTKSADDFYASKTNKDKLHSYCKTCMREQMNSKKAEGEAAEEVLQEPEKSLPTVMEKSPEPSKEVAAVKQEIVRPKNYLTMQRAKELVMEAYMKGRADAQSEIQEADVSLDELLNVG